MPLFKSVLYGTAFAVGVIIILSIFTGVICLFADISDELLGAMSVLILTAAAYASGWRASQIKRNAGLLQGLLCGAVLFGTVLLISIICGMFSFKNMTFVKAGACLIFGALGGVIGVNTKKTGLRH